MTKSVDFINNMSSINWGNLCSYESSFTQQKNISKRTDLTINKGKFQKPFVISLFPSPVGLFYLTLFPLYPAYLHLLSLVHVFPSVQNFLFHVLVFLYFLPFLWVMLPLKMPSVLFTLRLPGHTFFLVSHLQSWVVISCNSAPVTSSSGLFYPHLCPFTFHSPLVSGDLFSCTTSGCFRLDSSPDLSVSSSPFSSLNVCCFLPVLCSPCAFALWAFSVFLVPG